MHISKILPKYLDLISDNRLHTFPKGETISTSEDKDVMWYVSRGYVKRYLITNKGTISTQAIYGAGDFFSLTRLIKITLEKTIYSGPETYFYEAMRNTTLVKIVPEKLLALLDKDPSFYKVLLGMAGDRLESNIQQLENQGLLGARQRVAHQILFYANRFGRPKSTGVEIAISLTHQDIADVLNLTRETVSNCFSELKKKGIIGGKRRIVVLDMEKIETESYS